MADEEMTADTFSLADYQGKVVYLDFWASWCGPCRATFPLMNELQEKHGNKLKVIAVNVDNKRSDADRFLEKHPASFSIVYDPKGQLATQYQLQGMPTSFYFDQQGNPAGTHVGFRKRDAEIVRDKIAQLISKGASIENDSASNAESASDVAY